MISAVALSSKRQNMCSSFHTWNDNQKSNNSTMEGHEDTGEEAEINDYPSIRRGGNLIEIIDDNGDEEEQQDQQVQISNNEASKSTRNSLIYTSLSDNPDESRILIDQARSHLENKLHQSMKSAPNHQQQYQHQQMNVFAAQAPPPTANGKRKEDQFCMANNKQSAVNQSMDINKLNSRIINHLTSQQGRLHHQFNEHENIILIDREKRKVSDCIHNDNYDSLNISDSNVSFDLSNLSVTSASITQSKFNPSDLYLAATSKNYHTNQYFNGKSSPSRPPTAAAVTVAEVYPAAASSSAVFATDISLSSFQPQSRRLGRHTVDSSFFHSLSPPKKDETKERYQYHHEQMVKGGQRNLTDQNLNKYLSPYSLLSQPLKIEEHKSNVNDCDKDSFLSSNTSTTNSFLHSRHTKLTHSPNSSDIHNETSSNTSHIETGSLRRLKMNDDNFNKSFHSSSTAFSPSSLTPPVPSVPTIRSQRESDSIRQLNRRWTSDLPTDLLAEASVRFNQYPISASTDNKITTYIDRGSNNIITKNDLSEDMKRSLASNKSSTRPSTPAAKNFSPNHLKMGDSQSTHINQHSALSSQSSSLPNCISRPATPAYTLIKSHIHQDNKPNSFIHLGDLREIESVEVGFESLMEYHNDQHQHNHQFQEQQPPPPQQHDQRVSKLRTGRREFGTSGLGNAGANIIKK